MTGTQASNRKLCEACRICRIFGDVQDHVSYGEANSECDITEICKRKLQIVAASEKAV